MKRLLKTVTVLRKFFCSLIVGCSWAFTLALTVWNLLRFYPGDRWLPVRLGNFFSPWLFLALGPVLVVALLGGQTGLIRLTLVLIVIFGSRYRYLVSPSWPTVQADAKDWELKVMTFNLNYKNNHTDEIAALIRSQDADIVGLQELTKETAATLQVNLAADYPYFLLGAGDKNVQGLFSRYPLTRQAELPPPFTRHFQQVVVQTPAGPLTIINVHPRVAVKQKLWEFQRDTVVAIAERVSAVSGPLLVMGDFNTTDQTETYHLIATSLTDVHQEVGQGFGFTFPAIRRPANPWEESGDWPKPGPLVRIDLIFASSHFRPTSLKVLAESAGSDHRPVVATLKFIPGGN